VQVSTDVPLAPLTTLGLGGPAAPASGGPILYWHVDDVFAVMERLLTLGGELHQGLTDRGGGFVTASVTDPFGNVLAIMHNPHYLEILNSRSGP